MPKTRPSAVKTLRLIGTKHLQSRLKESGDMLEADVIEYLESLKNTKRVCLEVELTADNRIRILTNTPTDDTPLSLDKGSTVGRLKCVLCKGGTYKRSTIERSAHWRLDAHIDTKRKIGAKLYSDMGVNI
jgi:hypothetical protein